MSESATARAQRDQRIADAPQPNAALMCSAHGCPNRWSVDVGRRSCSAHAWADPHDWPAITQAQIDAETDRAYAAQMDRPQPRWLSREERVAVMQRLREALARMGQGGRDWAYRLRDREKAGEQLAMAQREAWRAAIAGVARDEEP